MWHINSIIGKIFDLMLTPLKTLYPFWPLLLFSILTAILILVLFGYTSNQKAIKDTKNKIKAHMLEVRLFKDNFGIILSAQKNILKYNLRYLRHALKPMIFIVVPVFIIIIQLHSWFGYRPLRPGESALFAVELADSAAEVLPTVQIEVDGGLIIKTPSLQIFEKREVNWKIEASQLGEHYVTVRTPDYEFRKEVLVSNGQLARVSPARTISGFWDMFVNVGEKPIEPNPFLKRIEIDYPSRSLKIFRWNAHWLVVFSILSILFAFAFKGFFKLEL